MADTALKVNLLADISDLVSKMGTAKETVGSSMVSMETAFNTAKTAFIGLVGVGSVGAFATMITGAINAQGALQDLATKTGASAAALDAFRVIGATSETSIDNVATAINKLGKNMVTGTTESKGASEALKALGLDFDVIKNMKPEDQMLAIAGRMNEFADGADKGTAAQLLFGKAGADLLPFLKDLGNEAGGVTTKLTEQEIAYRATQAAMADAFGDNLTTIARETGQWKRDLSEGMTPALLSASTAFLSVATESGGMRDKINEMSRDGTFTTWTQGAITGLTYVMDAFSGVGTVVQSVGLVIGAWAAGLGSAVTTAMTSFKQATDGDFSGAMTTIKGGIEQQKTIAGELATSLDATWGEQTLGSKLRARMADTTALGAASEATKPQLDVSAALAASETARVKDKDAQREQEKAAKDLAKEIKTQEDKYTALTTAIDAKIASGETELTQGTKVTAAQAIEIKYLADLAAGTTKFTDAQKAEIETRIARLKEVEAETAAAKEEKAATEANTKAYGESAAKIEKETQSIEAAIAKQTEHNSTLFLTKEELQYLGIERDLEAARSLIAQANAMEEEGKYGAVATGLRDQAAALTTLAGLKEQGIHVQAAKDAAVEWEKTTKSIGDGLSSNLLRAVTDGKDIWLTFRDYMVQVILDGVIKSALSGVIQEALTGFNSSLGGLLSAAFSRAATGPSASAGSTLTSIGGNLSSVGSSLAGGAADVGNLLTGGGFGTGGSLLGGGSAAASGAGAAGASAGAGTATAAGGGSSLASVGAYIPGAIAAVGAAYILSSMLSGPSVTRDLIDSGTLDYSGPFGAIKIPGGRDEGDTWYQPKEGAKVAYEHDRTNTGIDEYVVSVDGHTVGGGYTLAEAMQYISNPIIPPGYAGGGDFGGGIRIVGENGPELEVTGPSRIFDAQTTASMLRSGGASDSEVAREMAIMNGLLTRILLEGRRTADAVNGSGEAPMLTEVDA